MDTSPDLFGWEPSRSYPDTPGSKEKGGTSEEAAEAIAGHAATLRRRVFDLLATGEAMTADEIAQQLDETILSVRPRVSELHRQGLIEKTGDRRKNSSGMSASVWRRAQS